MKLVSLFLIAFGISSVSAHADERSIFSKIAGEAQTGNGSTKISKFDKTLKKPQLVEQSKKDLEKDYWENCGPWKTMTSRREAIQKIEKIESSQDKSKVAEQLKDLYEKDKIVAAFGTISNNEVECSLSWFHFYGSDGTMLELKYNDGD